MSGKPNKEWIKTRIATLGSREAVRAEQQRIGRLGGMKTGVKKGFAANPELAVIAGAIGGKKGTRLGIKNGQGVTRRKYEKNTSNN